MLGADEVERLILARCDLAVRMIAMSEEAIAKACHDAELSARLRGYLDGVRREMSAFAVRTEDAGPFRSEADVGAAMEREFETVESTLCHPSARACDRY
jgi:hypothetical protein